MLKVASLGRHIRNGQDSRLIELALDRDAIVLARCCLVVVVIARQVKGHKISELEVGKRSWPWRAGKGNLLPLRNAGRARDVRTREERRLCRLPVKTPGCVSQDAEVPIVGNSQIVDAPGCANAGFTRLTPDPTRRCICETNPGRQVIPASRRNGTGNSWISRDQVA